VSIRPRTSVHAGVTVGVFAEGVGGDVASAVGIGVLDAVIEGDSVGVTADGVEVAVSGISPIDVGGDATDAVTRASTLVASAAGVDGAVGSGPIHPTALKDVSSASNESIARGGRPDVTHVPGHRSPSRPGSLFINANDSDRISRKARILTRIAWCEGFDDIHTLYHATEDRVAGDIRALAFLQISRIIIRVKPGRRSIRHEKLASARVRSAVGHRQNPRPVVFQFRIELVWELITRSTRSGTGRVPGLSHETWKNAMERRIVVETFASQKDEIVDGVWRLVRKERDDDVSLFRFECGLVGSAGVNYQRRRGCVHLITGSWVRRHGR
jgi:hypothetical protein